MTKLSSAFAILCLAAGFASLAETHDGPARKAKLYVTNSEGDDLTLVDPLTMKVTGNVKVGQHPHGVAASPDGRTLYVSIEGTNELVALDTSTDRVIARAPVGRTPNQITITRDGRYVFVPLRDEAAVDIFDTSQMKVVDRIKVPEMPHNTYTSHNGQRIYVGSMSGARITVIDAASRRVLHEIAPGSWVRPIALRRDETLAYVALSGLHGFAVLDLKERKTIRKVELPALPPGTPKPYLDTYTHGIALTPDERELYVTSMPGNAVYVYTVPELKQTARIEVGNNPNWIAVHPSGRFVFVSNMSSDTVSAIDTSAKKVVATIPVGRVPKRLIVVEPKS